MKKIDKTKLEFGLGNENENDDFGIFSDSNELKNTYEYLIFTDSKGNSAWNKTVNTWTDKLVARLEEKGISYLFISRPKEMTVFFTLLNFISKNDIIFKNLITNLGFVDTTPKKMGFIDDIFEQNPFCKEMLTRYPFSAYKLRSGEFTTLYSVKYNLVVADIAKRINDSFIKAYLIGTFEFSPKIMIERKRPAEFFSQLPESNNLIRSICNCNSNLNFIEVNRNSHEDESILSYDAVHFTEEGHNRMISICIEKINF